MGHDAAVFACRQDTGAGKPDGQVAAHSTGVQPAAERSLHSHIRPPGVFRYPLGAPGLLHDFRAAHVAAHHAVSKPLFFFPLTSERAVLLLTAVVYQWRYRLLAPGFP